MWEKPVCGEGEDGGRREAARGVEGRGETNRVGSLAREVGPGADCVGRLAPGVCPEADCVGRLAPGVGPETNCVGRLVQAVGPETDCVRRLARKVGPEAICVGRLVREAHTSALPVPYQCLTSALLSALPSALPRVLWCFALRRVKQIRTLMIFVFFKRAAMPNTIAREVRHWVRH